MQASSDVKKIQFGHALALQQLLSQSILTRPAAEGIGCLSRRALVNHKRLSLSITSDLTPGYFDFQAGSSARRGAALAAGAVAAVRAVFDLRRS